MERIKGIHHITAIADSAQRNLDFYTKVLGLRLVKRTVNFDDPGTYHFYFGDELGTPGTILTFFPWEGIRRGRLGTGMATEFTYAVPAGSLGWWEERLKQHGAAILKKGGRFDEEFLSFEDPDGLHVSLLVPTRKDERKPWIANNVEESFATRGFHSITLRLNDTQPTGRVLIDILGYQFIRQEGNVLRFATDANPTASIVDLVQDPGGARGTNAGGTIHHVAFRVNDERTLMEYREKVLNFGLNITPKIDRNYFFSLYFREPGGVLFEIATDNPGFAVDEPVGELGASLKLPPQYESSRKQIEQLLPLLT